MKDIREESYLLESKLHFFHFQGVLVDDDDEGDDDDDDDDDE